MGTLALPWGPNEVKKAGDPHAVRSAAAPACASGSHPELEPLPCLPPPSRHARHRGARARHSAGTRARGRAWPGNVCTSRLFPGGLGRAAADFVPHDTARFCLAPTGSFNATRTNPPSGARNHIDAPSHKHSALAAAAQGTPCPRPPACARTRTTHPRPAAQRGNGPHQSACLVQDCPRTPWGGAHARLAACPWAARKRMALVGGFALRRYLNTKPTLWWRAPGAPPHAAARGAARRACRPFLPQGTRCEQ
ncbi:MAG: hypothetical protein J3K34DRAFT_438524 [Monoraphidium minutum]|nr:MAG: hypothetical protein J3K34DRAFT_438524 [Monoraphidium minutum]